MKEPTDSQHDTGSNLSGEPSVPLTTDSTSAQWSLHLDGDANMTEAVEMKQALIEGLSSGKEVYFDLERAQEIDIAILQLLWAAARDAASNGLRFSSHVSEAAAAISRHAGFQSWLAEPLAGQAGDGRE